MKKTVWTLRASALQRFSAGHPWVYLEDLEKGLKLEAAGSPVELRSHDGRFLALGYGNLQSKIVFRTLSRDSRDQDFFTPESVLRKFQIASDLRWNQGFKGISHRACYSEADSLPGLIVDHYVLKGDAHVLCVQVLTAGMERLILPSLERPVSFLKPWAESRGIDLNKLSLVLRNDVSTRELEGLSLQRPRVIKNAHPDLRHAEAVLKNAILEVDLIEGQKTGLFLDQSRNIELACEKLLPLLNRERLRVLDLFCYMGQWGASLAESWKAQVHRPVEVTLVDASSHALDYAERNVTRTGATVQVVKMDLVQRIQDLISRDIRFDVVVCDPPALIKTKKDQVAGRRAYLKLLGASIDLLAPGGLLVACSCSQNLSEDDFAEVLAQASERSGRALASISAGEQASDHPILKGFEQSSYLKCRMGFVPSS